MFSKNLSQTQKESTQMFFKGNLFCSFLSTRAENLSFSLSNILVKHLKNTQVRLSFWTFSISVPSYLYALFQKANLSSAENEM